MVGKGSIDEPPVGGAGGEDHAVVEAYRRYAGRLVMLARHHLDARLRQKIDPDDVIQSVFRSFCWRMREGQFVADWDGLWRLLVTITLRKCADQAEHYHAQRRDVRREVDAAASTGDSFVATVSRREPSPEEGAMLAETITGLLRQLDAAQQEVVVLHLQGFSAVEISQQIGRAERTVRRILQRARKRLLEAYPSAA